MTRRPDGVDGIVPVLHPGLLERIPSRRRLTCLMTLHDIRRPSALCPFCPLSLPDTCVRHRLRSNHHRAAGSSTHHSRRIRTVLWNRARFPPVDAHALDNDPQCIVRLPKCGQCGSCYGGCTMDGFNNLTGKYLDGSVPVDSCMKVHTGPSC